MFSISQVFKIMKLERDAIIDNVVAVIRWYYAVSISLWVCSLNSVDDLLSRQHLPKIVRVKNFSNLVPYFARCVIQNLNPMLFRFLYGLGEGCLLRLFIREILKKFSIVFLSKKFDEMGNWKLSPFEP